MILIAYLVKADHRTRLVDARHQIGWIGTLAQLVRVFVGRQRLVGCGVGQQQLARVLRAVQVLLDLDDVVAAVEEGARLGGAEYAEIN